MIEATPNSDVTIKSCLKRLLKYVNAFQEMVDHQVIIFLCIFFRKCVIFSMNMIPFSDKFETKNEYK